jgi:transcriptional regulator with XRE-family HTH domain
MVGVSQVDTRLQEESSVDDRGEALFWYIHMLIANKLGEGTKAADLARLTGVTKAQLSQIQSGRPGGGLLTLIRFAKIDHRTPGQILDAALSWWEKVGRRYRAAFKAREAQEASRVLSASEADGFADEILRGDNVERALDQAPRPRKKRNKS